MLLDSVFCNPSFLL